MTVFCNDKKILMPDAPKTFLNENCIRVPIEEGYPKYIIENQEAFESLGFIY